MNKYTLKAQKRKVLGRKVKALRKVGLVPANVYGKKVKSEAVEIKLEDFLPVFEEAGETGIVELLLGKTKKPVLIQNLQKDPVTDELLHIDFRQVDLKEKIKAQVPVELVGEAPAEKSGLGTAVQQIDELEVEALPADLPEKFEVDIAKLAEVDQAVFVKDLKRSDKVEILADAEQIIVKIEPPQEEKETVLPEAGIEEVAEGEEAPTEEKAAEGEATEETKETEGEKAPQESKA